MSDENMDTSEVTGHSIIPEDKDFLKVNAQFLSYNALIAEFFLSDDAFGRLDKIYKERENGVFEIIVFFVKVHQKNKIIRNSQNSFHCIADQYKAGVTSHKKRYYDFKSRQGRGDLVYNGKVNPLVSVEKAGIQVALPLPCLVACWWFIQNNFDTFFWEQFGEVKEEYEVHVANNKRIYSATHKVGKSKLREAVIKKVIKQREENKEVEEKPKNKKRPFLTRPERRLVSNLVVSERANMKAEQQKRSKKTQAKHRNKETAPVIITQAGTLCGDEDGMDIKE